MNSLTYRKQGNPTQHEPLSDQSLNDPLNNCSCNADMRCMVPLIGCLSGAPSAHRFLVFHTFARNVIIVVYLTAFLPFLWRHVVVCCCCSWWVGWVVSVYPRKCMCIFALLKRSLLSTQKFLSPTIDNTSIAQCTRRFVDSSVCGFI